jgi:cell division septation protein DedD
MTLSKYISDLLYRYECVIIPEFGGFLTKTISARIDEKTQVIYPPTKKLSFNAHLKENDGLLANHVAVSEKIPYDSALNYILFEVENWQKKLQNESVELEGIGVFSINNEQKILFEPDPDANFLIDSFGLSTISTSHIARKDYMDQEVVFESISDLVKAQKAAKKVSKKTPVIPILRYAAVFAILLTAGFFLGKQILINNASLEKLALSKEEQEKMLNKRIQEATFEINKALPAINLYLKNEKTESQEVTDETTQTSNNVYNSENETPLNSGSTTPELSIKKPYHIIAGAFREPANATKKISQLTEKGFPAHVVGKNKYDLTQVAFESYATMEEAKMALGKIRQTEAKDAWILIK